MKETRLIMGMPITVEVVDKNAIMSDLEDIFTYFKQIDNRFSTYKQNSEINMINNGLISPKHFSADMTAILKLSEQTKQQSHGFFDIERNGAYDPSGLVKGWAINNAAKLLHNNHFQNYYVEAGGDIQVSGTNSRGEKWRIGIRNPFNRFENVKVLEIDDRGVATSGTYIRGQHVYNPKHPNQLLTDIVSLTVIGPDIYEADRFATAAFAMGKDGINFIESLPGFEAYMIDRNGIATYTSGFSSYVSAKS